VPVDAPDGTIADALEPSSKKPPIQLLDFLYYQKLVWLLF